MKVRRTTDQEKSVPRPDTRLQAYADAPQNRQGAVGVPHQRPHASHARDDELAGRGAVPENGRVGAKSGRVAGSRRGKLSW